MKIHHTCEQIVKKLELNNSFIVKVTAKKIFEPGPLKQSSKLFYLNRPSCIANKIGLKSARVDMSRILD